MKYKLVFERKNVEIGVFSTLFAAKMAAYNYEKQNRKTFTDRDYDFFNMCFVITGIPKEGLEVKTYFRRLCKSGYNKWVKEKEVLVTSLIYRGIRVNVYNDDWGQSFYFRYRNKHNEIETLGCGTYNVEYEEEIHSVIDYMLDTIAAGNDFAYFGARLRFTNPEHTEAELVFRSEPIAMYISSEPLNIDEVITEAKADLEKWCTSEEFLKAEAERKEAIAKGDRGKMYFHELMEEEDKK